MAVESTVSGVGTLAGWAQRPRPQRQACRGEAARTEGTVRFALYGRMSTTEYQHRETSCGWQRQVADELIAGHGVVVATYFDVGVSRRLSWNQRPQAAALLSTAADQHRDFDAVVVGEYERAFEGDQFTVVTGRLAPHGVRLWLPEAGGPVEPDSPTHQALMLLLGAHAKREVLRSRHRVLTAMRTQAHTQGRYLGGRPPYGYRLVDTGPHPNRAQASWGRRAHRLAPDPATAPHVRWMFAQRLAGRSKAGIARELNERAIPCPSQVDRQRNPHRSGEAWTLRTVAAILANPRYTGRQVWNRHGTDHEPAELTSAGTASPAGEWVISKAIAHTPLVSEDDFVAAQAVHAARATAEGSIRTYLLRGLLVCGLCARRMEAHWVNGRAGYRCRHGQTSSRAHEPRRMKIRYVREDHLLDELAQRYGITGTPHEVATEIRERNLTITCEATGWSATSKPSSTASIPEGALF